MRKPYNTNYNTVENSNYTANKDQAMINDITHELRNFANSGMSAMECATYSDKLIAIADRIQLEHERLMVERADRYSELRAKMNNCYIELPKDADDVPWHVGDCDEDGNEVIELRRTSSGWFVVTDDMEPYRPERKRHHHVPTVEDVLREFADLVRKERVELATIGEDAIAEYASKLRLAEGED